MAQKKLFKWMSDNGKKQRPSDKPVSVEFEWVEVSRRLSANDLRELNATRRLYKKPLPKKSAALTQLSESERVHVPQITKVSGRLTECTTSERGGAPSPIAGNPMTYGVEDKGHIIGLQLGGVDSSFNIVPQLRKWQQIYAWRKMETDILDIVRGKPEYYYEMIVELTYGRQPIIPISFGVTVADPKGSKAYQNKLDNMPDANEVAWQDKNLARVTEQLAGRLGAERDSEDDEPYERSSFEETSEPSVSYSDADDDSDSDAMAIGSLLGPIPPTPPGELTHQHFSNLRKPKPIALKKPRRSPRLGKRPGH